MGALREAFTFSDRNIVAGSKAMAEVAVFIALGVLFIIVGTLAGK